MCVAKTCARRRVQMKNDKRYSSYRKDIAARTRKADAKLQAERERSNRSKK